jgi:hypothetical protein
LAKQLGIDASNFTNSENTVLAGALVTSANLATKQLTGLNPGDTIAMNDTGEKVILHADGTLSPYKDPNLIQTLNGTVSMGDNLTPVTPVETPAGKILHSNADGSTVVEMPDGTVNTYNSNDELVSSVPKKTDTTNYDELANALATSLLYNQSTNGGGANNGSLNNASNGSANGSLNGTSNGNLGTLYEGTLSGTSTTSPVTSSNTVVPNTPSKTATPTIKTSVGTNTPTPIIMPVNTKGNTNLPTTIEEYNVGETTSSGALSSSVDLGNRRKLHANETFLQGSKNMPQTPKILQDLNQLDMSKYHQAQSLNPDFLKTLGVQFGSLPSVESNITDAMPQQSPIYENNQLTATSINPPKLKNGGALSSVHVPQFITGATGHYVKGKGDGQSDDIPAMLADGEYVFDADTVAALGNGSSDAGAKLLDHFRESLREHKRSAPNNKIPPPASPLVYMKEALKRHSKG